MHVVPASPALLIAVDPGLVPGLVAHAVHYLLVVGGLIGVFLLVSAARPAAVQRAMARPVVPRTETEHRVEQLRREAAGGTLVAAATRPRAPFRPPSTPTPVSWPFPVAVVCFAAAAGVHAAAVPVHRSSALALAFFSFVALAQLAWAARVLLGGGTRWLAEVGLVLQLGVVVVWGVSRSVGLPFGLGREPVGPWDLMAALWQLVSVAVLVVACSRSPRSGSMTDPRAWPRPALVAATVSVVVLVALTGAGAPG